MPRRRGQKGSLQVRRHGSRRMWVAQWRDELGRGRTKVLGEYGRMSEAEARSALEAILRPVNEATAPRTLISLREYVETAWMPLKAEIWKKSTAWTSGHRIRKIVLESLGHLPVTSLSRRVLQDFLFEMAGRYGRSVVDHLRWDLRDILALAVSDGLLLTNPAEKLHVPRRTAGFGRGRDVLSPEEIARILGRLRLRERLVFRLAVFEGLRPGEILALRWRDIQPGHVQVRARVYRTDIDTPKNDRARASALSRGTELLLEEWRRAAAPRSEEEFVFCSQSGRTPVSRDNIWRRHLGPVLKSLGLEWATFQVMRRTNASRMQRVGVDPKVGADQRGHGLGVSLEVYTVSGLEAKSEAVQRLERLIPTPFPESS